MKVCPICGNDNKCSHGSICWCTTFVFEQKTKEYLEKNYKGKPCVCQQCVDKLNTTL